MGDWNTLPIRLSAIESNGGHHDIFIGVDLHIGNDGFSRKNSPVDYF